jgi:hypothetical protein
VEGEEGESVEEGFEASGVAVSPRKTHEAGLELACCLVFSVKRIFSRRMAMGKEEDGGVRRLVGV